MRLDWVAFSNHLTSRSKHQREHYLTLNQVLHNTTILLLYLKVKVLVYSLVLAVEAIPQRHKNKPQEEGVQRWNP